MPQGGDRLVDLVGDPLGVGSTRICRGLLGLAFGLPRQGRGVRVEDCRTGQGEQRTKDQRGVTEGCVSARSWRVSPARVAYFHLDLIVSV